ncbi:nuclear transport factor 2 family protein [Gephyromycinifex aptenodytis]|uniref:nuclear transport factor 2 family protein n=1 Tax=Gephyromycinifex aptenodytis TaxID=2716227 RepID=UPI001446DCCB|nr:nuclear transport factor 2 family protein [Gephyromycinifex aptenodytis]
MSNQSMHGLRAAVQGYYDALDREDIETALDYFGGEILYRRPGYEPITGLERLRAYYTQDRLLASGRHVIRSVVVEGHSAAAHGTFEGELKDGGRTTTGFAAFFTFDGGGRIIEHTTYFFVPAV